MSKLVDVEKITDDEIISYLGPKYASCADDVRNLLNDQPTAYDLDAVVKELDNINKWLEFMIFPLNYRERKILERVVEIVKAGGRHE